MEGLARCALVFALLVSAVAWTGLSSGGAKADGSRLGPAGCIFDHAMLRTAPDRCRPRARVYPRGVAGKIKRAIYDSALIFGVPYPVLLRIARCESGLNPRATYGDHFGLFQFVPPTFVGGARSMRASTGISARSLWNPLDASYVAGYLFAVGESPRWACR